jgi:hypothetical protein
MDQLNRSIASNVIEGVIKSPPLQKKGPEPERFTPEFYQTFKEELIPTLLKLLHKIEKEGLPPNSFYEASITFIPKLDKDTHKKRELQADLFNELKCKKPK